ESRANRKLPIREAQLPVCRQLVQNLRKGRDRGFFFDPRVLLLPLLAPLNNAFTVRPPSGLQFEPRPDGIGATTDPHGNAVGIEDDGMGVRCILVTAFAQNQGPAGFLLSCRETRRNATAKVNELERVIAPAEIAPPKAMSSSALKPRRVAKGGEHRSVIVKRK